MGIAYKEFLPSKRKQTIWQKLRQHLHLLSADEQLVKTPGSELIDLPKSLANLSADELVVLAHCDWWEYSHSETAKQLDMPLGSVKTCLLRARKIALGHFIQDSSNE